MNFLRKLFGFNNAQTEEETIPETTNTQQTVDPPQPPPENSQRIAISLMSTDRLGTVHLSGDLIRKALAVPIYDKHLTYSHDELYRWIREESLTLTRWEAEIIANNLVGPKSSARGGGFAFFFICRRADCSVGVVRQHIPYR